jgi:hypothetical protein
LFYRGETGGAESDIFRGRNQRTQTRAERNTEQKYLHTATLGTVGGRAEKTVSFHAVHVIS